MLNNEWVQFNIDIRSSIFNIQKKSHLDKADGGFVVMTDGTRIPVASRKRDMLLELFDEIE